MIPIISIVGKSNSGKTTLIEKLIPELKKRGYRVATVKHDVHGFDMDKEGKDTWRHRQAGSFSTAISSPSQFAIIRDMDHDMTLQEVRDRFIHDVDIVISEGYKKDKEPKVEIFRKGVHKGPLCTRDDKLIAIISDQKFDLGVPSLELDDIGGLVDVIENKFLKGDIQKSVSLMVNGKDIKLKPFIRNLIIQSIKGMISSLKGCDKPEEIEIRIK